MTNNLKNSVVNAIKEKHITPKPRWQFALQHIGFWTIFALSSIIGAKALTLFIFTAQRFNLPLLLASGGKRLGPLFQTLPFFWIPLFILFIALAILGLHKTPRGYTLSLTKLVALNIGATALLTCILLLTGAPEQFEHQLNARFPKYHDAIERKGELWQHPENGRLTGTIDKVVSQEEFILQDSTDTTWRVTAKKEAWPPGKTPETSLKIHLVGEQTGEGSFKAKRIQPWPDRLPPRPRPPKKEFSQQ